MDTEEWTRLQADRSWLESALLTIEKALDASPPDGQAERARLTAEMHALLVELDAVNTRLSALRGRSCST